jgi:hypothetical protein
MLSSRLAKFALSVGLMYAAAWTLARATQTAGGQQPAVIRVTTRLVVVNVVAQEKHGGPVKDLKLDDFELLDNGHKEKISVFSVETRSALPNP